MRSSLSIVSSKSCCLDVGNCRYARINITEATISKAGRSVVTMAKRWMAMLACIAALILSGPAAAAPSYMSYFGLGWDIEEAQDHVNLYWVVSWDWTRAEII